MDKSHLAAQCVKLQWEEIIFFRRSSHSSADNQWKIIVFIPKCGPTGYHPRCSLCSHIRSKCTLDDVHLILQQQQCETVVFILKAIQSLIIALQMALLLQSATHLAAQRTAALSPAAVIYR